MTGKGEWFVVTLRAREDSIPAAVRLRALLKTALRRWRLVAENVEELPAPVEPEKPPAPRRPKRKPAPTESKGRPWGLFETGFDDGSG